MQRPENIRCSTDVLLNRHQHQHCENQKTNTIIINAAYIYFFFLPRILIIIIAEKPFFHIINNPGTAFDVDSGQRECATDTNQAVDQNKSNQTIKCIVFVHEKYVE